VSSSTGQAPREEFRDRRAAYWRGRLKRHLTIVLAVTAFCVAAYGLQRNPSGGVRLSVATAYAGFLLIGATLILGPFNLMRSRPNPVTTDLRRDLGIWAALLSLAHVVLALGNHLGGRIWQYFVWPDYAARAIPIRHDSFGMANYLGLVATLWILLLLVISNDLSLRRLGKSRWKALQRWNYGVFLLAAAHTALFALITEREVGFIWILGATLCLVVGFQFRGFSIHRMKRRS
jgi:sulfoxide reductase heme-binding subunit YedZ